MHFGFKFTAEELQYDEDVTVVQCERDEVESEVQNADVVVPLMTPFPHHLLQRAPHLKLILQFGAGVEAIEMQAATELGIYVSNIPSAGTGNAASCAEMAVFLVLACLRNINAMQHRYVLQFSGCFFCSSFCSKLILSFFFQNDLFCSVFFECIDFIIVLLIVFLISVVVIIIFVVASGTFIAPKAVNHHHYHFFFLSCSTSS